MSSKFAFLLLGALALGAGSAAAQGQCEDVCNQPTTFCASVVCYDGSAKLTCKAWQGSPPCVEPKQGTNVVRYPDNIRWPQLPMESKASWCYGNCGSGCSDAWNPCGGPQQYWELTYVTPPTYGRFKYRICLAKRIYRAESMTYRARGRWTYHGYSAPGCTSHDSICPEATIFGCVLFAGCGSPKAAKNWFYDIDLVKFDGYLYGPELVAVDDTCVPGGFWPGW